MSHFAAYIPIGPGEAEVARAIDLVDSLCTYEPSIRWIVVVDDSPTCRRLEQHLRRPSTCELVVLPHPRQSENRDLRGGLCTATLIALSYMKDLDIDFVIKLDTDALIIDAFSQQIWHKFCSVPEAGMLGSLGDTCNRACRSYISDRRVINIIHRALAAAHKLSVESHAAFTELRELRIETESQMRAFARVCDRLATVTGTEFGGEHCQGGAYAVSRNMIERMSSRNIFEDRLLWLDVPIFGEDRMMGVYCATIGLKPLDFSGSCEPFGIQGRGIAYPPERLLQLGYSVIHSVKNDPRYSEDQIRDYFRSKRQDAIS